MLKLNLKTLRLIGLLEGISYLLLLGICMPLKYMFDTPEFVRPVGMAHGILFVAYCLWVFIVAKKYKWNTITIGLALIASLLPFGTFVADKKIFSKY